MIEPEPVHHWPTTWVVVDAQRLGQRCLTCGQWRYKPRPNVPQ